jgi:FkbM family methyltransferase
LIAGLYHVSLAFLENMAVGFDLVHPTQELAGEPTMNTGQWVRRILWNATRNKRINRALYKVASIYVACYDDASYDIVSNGERTLLQHLSPLDFRVVFDVGASNGEYAMEVLRWHPNARVYCFEVSPSNFAILKNCLSSERRARLIGTGLLDSPGKIAVKEYADGRLNTVLSKSLHSYDFHEVSGTVTTGDQFCAENGISEIDFVKIDTEGAEDRVIAGLSLALREQRIRFVQFEYGYANAYSKFLMHDYQKLFNRYGYTVGRIKAGGVDFTDEGMRANDFHRAPNFLAVRDDMETTVPVTSY